ncbi:MAG: PepSY-associated TM helix domain-containing protein, partial [Pseudomonadota bacterium]
MHIADEFRKSMNWLHTWLGIALSGVLFAVFWMGSLSVFMYETDQWMMPEARGPAVETVSLDETVLPWLEQSDVSAEQSVFVVMPSVRKPLLRVGVFGGDNGPLNAYFDPATGKQVERTGTFGSSGFFYPFHYSLHINWQGLGYWIVGLAAMAMLTLVVSGIFIHRKIVQDFFSFRPTKALRRSTLDLHNITGLVALPFHILFPLTGITIFALVYFEGAALKPFKGEVFDYTREANGYYVIERGRLPRHRALSHNIHWPRGC